MREIETWAPDLVAISYAGTAPERREIQLEIMEDSDLDIIVTTYQIATGNAEDRRFLRSLKCECLVLDEGRIKFLNRHDQKRRLAEVKISKNF
jgi:SWI/SNF-related matrix-associated actin-dependent regulator 1 of chromatin subfamily A